VAVALSSRRTVLVCVRTERVDNHRRHVEARDAVVRSVRAALG